MRLPRVRFTVRGLMLAVAVVAANLWGGLETAKYYPRPKLPLPISEGGAWGMIQYGIDGSISHYSGNAETGYRLESVEPGPPTTLRVWSPVICIAGLSSLCLVIAWLAARHPRLPVAPDPPDPE